LPIDSRGRFGCVPRHHQSDGKEARAFVGLQRCEAVRQVGEKLILAQSR
jgi:hypothetical protein